MDEFNNDLLDPLVSTSQLPIAKKLDEKIRQSMRWLPRCEYIVGSEGTGKKELVNYVLQNRLKKWNSQTVNCILEKRLRPSSILNTGMFKGRDRQLSFCLDGSNNDDKEKRMVLVLHSIDAMGKNTFPFVRALLSEADRNNLALMILATVDLNLRSLTPPGHTVAIRRNDSFTVPDLNSAGLMKLWNTWPKFRAMLSDIPDEELKELAKTLQKRTRGRLARIVNHAEAMVSLLEDGLSAEKAFSLALPKERSNPKDNKQHKGPSVNHDYLTVAAGMKSEYAIAHQEFDAE